MLTPCWPSAGPTGGDGFAEPANTWSLILAITCLAAIFRVLASPAARSNDEARALASHSAV